MSHLGLNEREVERVLAGHQPSGRDDLAEVAYFFARLRTLGDFEQPPAMSPKLLAELDAAEVERREDELARQRAQRALRARQMRRRWQLVGAAAAVTLLGGLFVVSSRDTTTTPQTETDGKPAGQIDSDTTAPTVPSSLPPETSSTTAPPATTAAPSTTQQETTTAPPPEAPADADGPGSGPQGGPNLWPPPADPSQDEGYEDFIDHWEEHCERQPHDDYCIWYRDYRDYVEGNGR